jgi:cytochrome c oxidase subunit 1
MALILLSCPLGLHHQFADPGISTTNKGIQTVLTLFVVIPSLLTAFTIAASLDLGARKRGGTGLFGWWKKLPYFESESWLFPYLFCGLIIFLFGGITGIVNASYSLNTAWIPAHFHLTFGGPVFLGILGMSLFLITGILKKPVVSTKMAMLVPYIWMVGTFIFSTGYFIGGLRGEPRRTNLGMTYLNPSSPLYRPDWRVSTHLGMIGGCIMGLACLLFLIVLIRSLLAAPDPALANVPFTLPMSEPYYDEDIAAVRNLTPWVVVAVLLCAVAYYAPVSDIVRNGYITHPGFSPNDPVAVQTTH